MDSARFAFELTIVALDDQVPGPAELRSLVSTSAQVSVEGNPASPTADSRPVTHTVFTDWPGPVPVQILIVRHTHSRSETGSIVERQGHWFWVGGGQEIALQPNDPCVTRVLPGGHPMSDREFAEFCQTRILEPPVAPGVVGTIDFRYDLATGKAGDLRGDVTVVRPITPPLHPTENEFQVHKSLSPYGAFDVTFRVGALNTRGFAADIRPLFRDVDIESMQLNSGPNSGTDLPAGFDLSSYETVKAYAARIFPLVSVQGSRTAMPCDWRMAPWARPGWAAGWPEGRILVFKQWMDQGMPP